MNPLRFFGSGGASAQLQPKPQPQPQAQSPPAPAPTSPERPVQNGIALTPTPSEKRPSTTTSPAPHQNLTDAQSAMRGTIVPSEETPRPTQTTDPFSDSAAASSQESLTQQQNRLKLTRSQNSKLSMRSMASVPPPGSILTGKQEHYLKRELVSVQTKYEISELASPTALQRFGAPFRSDKGEVAPEDSELPILRYIFVHFVRNFPFLDQAREKEFWQDKLQVFLESFANKRISGSEDRLEETKRRKLALKAEKLVELMMVSGIPTASGYEERIRFSEIDIVERGANEQGLVVNIPQGHEINGWDVNVAGVRTTSVKRHVKYHQHSEFLIRVKQAGKPEIYVGRRFGDFAQMHKRLRMELPGKVLPPLPRKNKNNSIYASNDDDAESINSVNSGDTYDTHEDDQSSGGGLRGYLGIGGGHRRNRSAVSLTSRSPRASVDSGKRSSEPVVLFREDQRVSLRAFLRTFLQNQQIANSKAMTQFLTHDPITLNEEELYDIERRKEMDAKRIEEQRQFYEIARKRAKELDVHMEKFRRDIVERNGLTKLFQEIKIKKTIAELSPEYQKFAEFLRIEVAATIYHIFLAEDNSAEVHAQSKRIHSLIPYGMLKNIIRIANPAAVMSGVLDLFLAQPFGSRSLMQRILTMAISDNIKAIQKSADTLIEKTGDPILCEKIKSYSDAEESIKEQIRQDARSEGVDLVCAILRSDLIAPELSSSQTEKVFNAYVAWTNAVETVSAGPTPSSSTTSVHSSAERNGSADTTGWGLKADAQMRQGAETYAYLKSLLKLYTRKRDKAMMLAMVEEPTSLQLFRDLFTIFYEPLVRVYKSANVYNSITDFALFMDDIIKTVDAAQRQDVSADPNQTVQAFIDLCARHEDNFYKFVHEVHVHDNGLFDQLMGWIENILEFLRQGPKGGKLDMNALVQGALDQGTIEKGEAIKEVNALIKWQTARKRWHQDKTRQKMAAEGGTGEIDDMGALGLGSAFKSSDFGLNQTDIDDLEINSDDESEEDSDEEEDGMDPIAAERKRRAKRRDHLRRYAGEPVKPEVKELHKLHPGFVTLLRGVLAE